MKRWAPWKRSAAIIKSNNGPGLLTSGSDNSSSTFAGNIQSGSGSVSLSKSGSGTLVLSSTNTISGPLGLSISGGTLTVNGSATAFNVTLSSGVLNGSGTMQRSRHDQRGHDGVRRLGLFAESDGLGTYSPGNSPGITRVDGMLTLNSSATLAIDVDDASAAPGVGYDQVQVGNGPSILSGAMLTLASTGATRQQPTPSCGSST